MKNDNGGAAFPVAAGPGQQFTQGMSLRDWFAGQAVMAIFGNDGLLQRLADHGVTPSEQAYIIADAMLAEREKGGGE